MARYRASAADRGLKSGVDSASDTYTVFDNLIY